MMNTLGSTIRNGTVWLFSKSLFEHIIKFAVGVILARLLMPEHFGLLITVQVFTGAAGFISGGGMGQALIRAKHASPDHFKTVFTLQFLICSLIYALFFFASDWFAYWFKNPIYSELLKVTALSFLIRPFANVARAKLSREMRFKQITIVSLCSLIFGSSTSVYLAANNHGVWSLAWGGLVGSSFSAMCFILISKCYPGIRFEKSIAKDMGSYGIKFSINDIINYLRNQAPNFIIGKILGPSTVGLYNKGTSLASMPIDMISGSAYQTVFRALSSTQDNLDKSKYIYLRTITLVSIYTMPFYVGLFWLAEPLIALVYGDKWVQSAISLKIFSIIGLLRCISNPSGAVMAAQNKLHIEIIIQLTTLVLALIGCLWGIQKNDLLFIALGIVPSYVFLTMSISYYSLKSLNATYKDLFKALAPAIILNSILTLIVILADMCYQIFWPNELESNIVYIATIATFGFISYSILFLYSPIPSLTTEVIRWKSKLHLTKNI